MTGNSSVSGSLSDIERTILQLAARGMNQYQIANETNYSVHTIKGYRARMVKKMGAGSLAEAISIAYATGLLSNELAA
jgi:DNA-binding CsgD family transcriptional regulator